MSNRMIQSLHTLKRLQDLNIKTLQPQLKDLQYQIDLIDQKIKKIEDDIQNQKDFLKTQGGLDIAPLAYFNKAQQDKEQLESKKRPLLSELEKLYDVLYDHVRSEKAYSLIQNKLIQEKESEEQKKEEDQLQDTFSTLTPYSESDY